MKHFLMLFTALILVAGCKNNRERVEEGVDTYGTEQTEYRERPGSFGDQVDSLGYYGVYNGASIEGGRQVKTKLVLYKDGHYLIESADLGGEYETAEERGRYQIFGDLLTLIPDNNGTQQYYKTGEDHVLKLDDDKKEIQGQHAQNYRLIKE